MKDLRPLRDEVLFDEIANHETSVGWTNPDAIFTVSQRKLIVIWFPTSWGMETLQINLCSSSIAQSRFFSTGGLLHASKHEVSL